jgi:hypothetical protein
MSNLVVGGGGIMIAVKKDTPTMRKRGQRTRTGKEKQLGRGAGRYIEALRELQKELSPDRFTREAVERAVAEYLGLDTPLGHATLIGIENGTRMPGFAALAAILDILGGNWQELIGLITAQASASDGEQLARQRLALNLIGGGDMAKKIVSQMDETQLTTAMQLFSNDVLLTLVRELADDPEAQRILRAVLDARNKP